MFELRYAEDSEVELKALRKFDRQTVIERIEEQLPREPDKETRNRKRLIGLKPPWSAVGETWELRIGEIRVFYDIDKDEKIVAIRAVRRKLPHQTTEDIL
ncbi:MAG: type II toxin-antitoxin system RelE family toxin [Planctomycetaceae bacterium]